MNSVIDYQSCLAGIYLLKVNNRNTRTRCEKCSRLTGKCRLGVLSYYLLSCKSTHDDHVVIRCSKRRTFNVNNTDMNDVLELLKTDNRYTRTMPTPFKCLHCQRWTRASAHYFPWELAGMLRAKQLQSHWKGKTPSEHGSERFLFSTSLSSTI